MLLNCSEAGDWSYLPARHTLVMELETVSELARQKFYLDLSLCLSPSPSTAKETSVAGSPAWWWLWGGEELCPRGSSISGSRAAVRSAAPLLGCGSSVNAAVGKMRFWLFPISLEEHAAVCVAHGSNKVWAEKKGKKTPCWSWRGGVGRDLDRV